MVEKNSGKGTLALTLWSPDWTATWWWKGLYSRSWAAGHMENWQIRHLFLYGISLLRKCANISTQRSSAGQQNRIYALIGGGWGKWVVIFKCSPFLRRRGRRNWLTRLVTVGGVFSEMHISLKIFLYVCCIYALSAPETENNTPNPRKTFICIICSL